jgi:hypothetical protein
MAADESKDTTTVPDKLWRADLAMLLDASPARSRVPGSASAANVRALCRDHRRKRHYCADFLLEKRDLPEDEKWNHVASTRVRQTGRRIFPLSGPPNAGPPSLSAPRLNA